jgi:peptide/nickel transport system substrate-binding protein
MSLDRRQFLKVSAAAAGTGVLSGIPLMAQAQAKGGVLNVVVQPEPPGIMIGIYQNVPSQMVGGNIFEGLLRFDADLNPHPLLAESWEEAPDGMFYSFKLKENVLWRSPRKTWCSASTPCCARRTRASATSSTRWKASPPTGRTRWTSR